MKDEAYDRFLQRRLPHRRELKSLFRADQSLVFFDIGACEGEDSIRYARLFPKAKVYTFEPLPANQKLIQYHFARHQVTKCELIPLALSDKKGTTLFYISSGEPNEKGFGQDWNYGNKSNSLLSPLLVKEEVPWLKFETTEMVQTETLDGFCASRGLQEIDFLHIDVQGAEFLVLKGAQETLPKIKSLWLEVSSREVYKGQKLKGDIERWLRSRGFRMTRQDLHGTEGDQFYVNMRFASGRMRFVISFFERGLRRFVLFCRRFFRQ